MLISACCGCVSTCGNLWFDPFDDLLSGYSDSVAIGGVSPNFSYSGGSLNLTPTIGSRGDDGIRVRDVAYTPSDGPVYVESIVHTPVGAARDPSTCGVIIGQPAAGGTNFFASLVWRPTVCFVYSTCTPIGECDVAGDFVLYYQIEGTSSVVGRAVRRGGPHGSSYTIRLEIQDTGGGGGGVYDILCFVDGVLCHVECDVAVTLTDPVPAGVTASDGGAWSYLCVGTDTENRTRYCTHTPNSYSFSLASRAGSCCEINEDQTYDLRKVGGSATACHYADLSDSRCGVCGGPRPQLWVETVVGGYLFTLKLERATTTTEEEAETGNEGLVWDTYTAGPFAEMPTAAFDLTRDAEASTSTCFEDVETLALTPDECGAVDAVGIETACCPDVRVAPTLTLTPPAAPLTSAMETYSATPLGRTPAGPPVGWHSTLTVHYPDGPPDESAEVLAYCDDEIDPETGDYLHLGWVVKVGTVTATITSQSCDPFEMHAEFDGPTVFPSMGGATVPIVITE